MARAHATVRRNLRYGVAGGERLLLDAYLPSGRNRPAIVFVHGGGFSAGDKARVAPGQQTLAPLARRLTQRGFAVFAINYRLAPRYQFPAAARDVLTAVRWVRRNARTLGVNPARLALFGASAGGNLAALTAVDAQRHSDPAARVQAAVSWSGPMDLTSFYPRHQFVAEYLGCIPASCPRRYRDASPASHVDPSDPPLLLVNGSTEIVPLTQAKAMAGRLRAAHVAHQLIVVPGSPHAGNYAAQVWNATVRFLIRYLRA